MDYWLLEDILVPRKEATSLPEKDQKQTDILHEVSLYWNCTGVVIVFNEALFRIVWEKTIVQKRQDQCHYESCVLCQWWGSFSSMGVGLQNFALAH